MSEKYVEGRYKVFELSTRRNRETRIQHSDRNLIVQTYTLDYTYVTPLLLTNKTYRKVLPVGTVLAYDPATGKAVPNYTSYGFGILGVLGFSDADCAEEGQDHSGDRVVACIVSGVVYEDRVWDNGTYGTALAATKSSLPRVDFVNSLTTTIKVWGDWGDWNVK